MSILCWLTANRYLSRITKKPGLYKCSAGLIDMTFSWLWEDIIYVLMNCWETFTLSILVFERIIRFFFFNACILKKSRDSSIAEEISLGLHNVQVRSVLCPSCISGNTSGAKHKVFSHVQRTYLCLIRIHSKFMIFNLGQGILNVTLGQYFPETKKTSSQQCF